MPFRATYDPFEGRTPTARLYQPEYYTCTDPEWAPRMRAEYEEDLAEIKNKFRGKRQLLEMFRGPSSFKTLIQMLDQFDYSLVAVDKCYYSQPESSLLERRAGRDYLPTWQGAVIEEVKLTDGRQVQRFILDDILKSGLPADSWQHHGINSRNLPRWSSFNQIPFTRTLFSPGPNKVMVLQFGADYGNDFIVWSEAFTFYISRK